MKNKKPLLPFSVWPYTWGTKGKTREILKAEYELSGYDLDGRLLELNKSELTDDEFNSKFLDIQYKYKKISDSEYYRTLASFIKDEKKRELANLELDFKERKINQLQYEKQIATLKGEPWVNVVKLEFTENAPQEGSFELDWNDKFIEHLEDRGYLAPQPDQVVNLWFTEVCRSVALETFDGVGTFTEDSQDALDSQEGEVLRGKRIVK